MKTALEQFRDRILNDLLPEFCDDPSRGWGANGFTESNTIHEIDASDFIRSIDGGLLKHEGRGLYRAPRSYASEQFFWSGLKKKNPRPITLWIEMIITVAVLARMHFDFGWPKRLIGGQSKDGAFDAATYLSDDADVEYIACEIKKTTAEMDQLIESMKKFGQIHLDHDKITPKEKNAFRKLQALRSRRPPLFWAVGPGGSNYVFKMTYAGDGMISFQKTTIQELSYRLDVRSNLNISDVRWR
jgi:hypothetical protein